MDILEAKGPMRQLTAVDAPTRPPIESFRLSEGVGGNLRIGRDLLFGYSA